MEKHLTGANAQKILISSFFYENNRKYSATLLNKFMREKRSKYFFLLGSPFKSNNYSNPNF